LPKKRGNTVKMRRQCFA